MAKKAVKKKNNSNERRGAGARKADRAKKKTKAKSGAVAKPKLTIEDMKRPDGDYLNRLLNQLESLGNTASSAAGDISTAIDKAYETKGVDKKALSILRSLRGMPVAKLQTTVPHLLLYIDLDKRLQKKLTDQAKMKFDGDGGDQAYIEDKLNKDGTPVGSKPQRERKPKADKPASPADAEIVQVDPRVRVWPLTVVPRPTEAPKMQQIPQGDDTMDAGDHQDDPIPASG